MTPGRERHGEHKPGWMPYAEFTPTAEAELTERRIVADIDHRTRMGELRRMASHGCESRFEQDRLIDRILEADSSHFAATAREPDLPAFWLDLIARANRTFRLCTQAWERRNMSERELNRYDEAAWRRADDTGAELVDVGLIDAAQSAARLFARRLMHERIDVRAYLKRVGFKPQKRRTNPRSNGLPSRVP